MANPLDEFASIDNILAFAQRPVAPMLMPGAPSMQPNYGGGGLGSPTPMQPHYGMMQPQGGGGTYPEAQQQPTRPPMKAAAPVAAFTTSGQLELLRELIKQAESSGNYQVKNKNTSASGAYQYVNGTWNNYGGYPEARLAPRAVQDARMNEDLARRMRRFNGDPFKIIAEHWLPKYANNPAEWTRPQRVGKTMVEPTANYIRKVIKGTPLEAQFDAYLQHYATQPR